MEKQKWYLEGVKRIKVIVGIMVTMKKYCEVLPSRRIGEVRMNLRNDVIVRYINGEIERVNRKLTKSVEFEIATDA